MEGSRHVWYVCRSWCWIPSCRAPVRPDAPNIISCVRACLHSRGQLLCVVWCALYAYAAAAVAHMLLCISPNTATLCCSSTFGCTQLYSTWLVYVVYCAEFHRVTILPHFLLQPFVYLVLSSVWHHPKSGPAADTGSPCSQSSAVWRERHAARIPKATLSGGSLPTAPAAPNPVTMCHYCCAPHLTVPVLCLITVIPQLVLAL